MTHRLAGLQAGVLAMFLALTIVPVAEATTASVRIVGDAVGVETTVDTTPGTFGPDSCPGHSAGGAIDKAVNANWDRMKFVSTILGESHTYTSRDYWNFFVNDTNSAVGICDHTVSPGDRILLFVQRDSPTFAPTVFPLTLSGAPPTVAPGQPFTVVVRELRFDYASPATTPVPVAGATVSGGGASAQTDATGIATLSIAAPGSFTLRATRPGNVPSAAATVTVSRAPAPPGSPPVPPVPPVLAPAADRSAPGASVVGIAEGRRFARGAGPRRLRARVAPDPSGLLAVKLRLTRNDRGRCTYFSGKSERFRRNERDGRCGAVNGHWFTVGSSVEVDYLLPTSLPRGRYVLDVKATDKANNDDDTRRRGSNRVVFHVG